jgi:hypothetical protein
MNRGRPAQARTRIIHAAEQMTLSQGWVNKSRIARELHVNIRTVFRVLPRISI